MAFVHFYLLIMQDERSLAAMEELVLDVMQENIEKIMRIIHNLHLW